jgi:hypothetical protein
MVVTTKTGTRLDLPLLYNAIPIVPYAFLREGVIKVKYQPRDGQLYTRGISKKDILKNTVQQDTLVEDFGARAKSKTRNFENLVTVVYRLPVGLNKWKEVNIKLFANGSLQATGIRFSLDICHRLFRNLFATLKARAPEAVAGELDIQPVETCLIKCDYFVGFILRRDILQYYLEDVYGYESEYKPTMYPGVRTRYYLNHTVPQPRPGICGCENICVGKGRGKGTSYGDGQCKAVTVTVFQTGKISIAASKMEQVRTVCDFINRILDRHYADIWRTRAVTATATTTATTTATAAAAAAVETKTKRGAVRVNRRRLVMLKRLAGAWVTANTLFAQQAQPPKNAVRG